jgi:phosphonate transport system permease protein
VRSALEALAELEAERRSFSVARVRRLLVVAAIVAFYLFAGYLVQIDLGRLASGLPKLAHWLASAWPPSVTELPIFIWRTAETVPWRRSARRWRH